MKTTLTAVAGILLTLAGLLSYASTEPQSLHAYTRQGMSLNGEWNIIVDPYETGYYNYRYEPYDQMDEPPRAAYFRDAKPRHRAELIEYDFDQADTLTVPGDWNTQRDELFLYEGSIWYRKTFTPPRMESGQRSFIYFGAANYRADVYLNGEKLGTHVGGFTPFHFEVTGKLKPQNNSLVVKVNNRRERDGVPALNIDWLNYGGLTRSVRLLVTPAMFIRDYQIQLDDHRTTHISGKVMLDGASEGQEVRVSLPELGINETVRANAEGVARFQTRALGAQLWSPESPRMYQLLIRSGNDRITDEVGLRQIETQGQRLLLNGRPIFLRGISMHDEYAVTGGGRVRSVQEAREQLQWASELGANFVRLAHYPHSEATVRLADQLGIMLWSEIPVYWGINWESEETYRNAQRQLTEMIQRDKNRASVIIWSLGNEAAVREERNVFFSRLAQHARSLDNTRLLTASMERRYDPEDPERIIVDDPLAEILDIISVNQYIGWYDGTPEKLSRVSWHIPYDKPVLISEFGAGAQQGLQGDSTTLWTEAYQAELYRKTLEMIDQIDGYVGTSPWVLTDFRSPRRNLPGIQDGFNRKGIMSERGARKEAYNVLSEYYRERASERVRLEKVDD